MSTGLAPAHREQDVVGPESAVDPDRLVARVDVRMTSQRGTRLADGWAEVELPRE